MLADAQLMNKIYSAGQTGLKKADLRKEFPQAEIDAILEKLTNEGKIFIDKKGTSYYCWLKESYMHYLLNTDPKFRLTHEAICSLERSVSKNSDRLATALETISLRIPDTNNQAIQESRDLSQVDFTSERIAVGSGLFREIFDEFVVNFSSSIGWVEIGKIRIALCEKYALTAEKFYEYLEQLLERYPDKYELSSGGTEGLTVRGLLHGYVRSI
jgi:hypothetical protein